MFHYRKGNLVSALKSLAAFMKIVCFITSWHNPPQAFSCILNWMSEINLTAINVLVKDSPVFNNDARRFKGRRKTKNVISDLGFLHKGTLLYTSVSAFNKNIVILVHVSLYDHNNNTRVGTIYEIHYANNHGSFKKEINVVINWFLITLYCMLCFRLCIEYKAT